MAAAAQSFSVWLFPNGAVAGRLGSATLNAGGQCYSLPAINHHMRCMVWLVTQRGKSSQNSRFPDFTYAPGFTVALAREVIQTFLLENDALVLQLEVLHMPIHSRPPQAGIRGLRKSDSAKYRIVAGAF